MIKYGIILLTICLCASLVLSFTYKMTQAKIQEQLTVDEKVALKEVFPQAKTFEEKTIDGLNYYLAKKDSQDLGYIIKVQAKGYSSTIVMIVGFDKAGQIKGIEVLSQQETPGLGAKIIEIKSGESKPWFLERFKGKNAKELDLKNIQAITSATITSRAVVESIRKSIEEFLVEIK
ncbi:MAG: RnfABCDGE type electron transport complex subunit G [Candidatus Omnitrophota bacterium]